MTRLNKVKSKLLNDQVGAAAITAAILGAVFIGVIAMTIPQYLKKSATASRDYRRFVFLHNVMTEAGRMAYNARQLAIKFAVCPGGTTQRMVNGQRFCFPSGANACITSPILQSPACIDMGALVSENHKDESGEIVVDFKYQDPENYAKRLWNTGVAKLAEAYVELEKRINPLPEANAFNMDFGRPPVPPFNAVTNRSRPRNCPADSRCMQCGGPGALCIRVRICEPGRVCVANLDYLMQRIIIYN